MVESAIADRPPKLWRRNSSLGSTKSDLSATKVQSSLSPRAVLPPLNETSAGSSPEADRHLTKTTTWPRTKSSDLNGALDGAQPVHDPGNLGTASAMTTKLANLSLSKPVASEPIETIKASWHEDEHTHAHAAEDDDAGDDAEDQPLTARAKTNSAFSDQADSPSSYVASRAGGHRRNQTWAGTPASADKAHRRTSSGGEAAAASGTPLSELDFSELAAPESPAFPPAPAASHPPAKNAIAYPVSQGLRIVRKSREPELISWDEIKAQKEVYQAVTTADGLNALVKATAGGQGSEQEYEVLLVADGPPPPKRTRSLVESVTEVMNASPYPEPYPTILIAPQHPPLASRMAAHGLPANGHHAPAVYYSVQAGAYITGLGPAPGPALAASGAFAAPHVQPASQAPSGSQTSVTAGFVGPASPPPSALSRALTMAPTTPVLTAPPNTPIGGIGMSHAASLPVAFHTPLRQSSFHAALAQPAFSPAAKPRTAAQPPVAAYMPPMGPPAAASRSSSITIPLTEALATVGAPEYTVHRQTSGLAPAVEALAPLSSQGSGVVMPPPAGGALPPALPRAESTASLDSLDMVLEGLPSVCKAAASSKDALPQSRLQLSHGAGDGPSPARQDPFGESAVW